MSDAAAHNSYVATNPEAVALRGKSETLSHLMDAGKFLFAKLTAKSRENRWLKINVHMFMREL